MLINQRKSHDALLIHSTDETAKAAPATEALPHPGHAGTVVVVTQFRAVVTIQCATGTLMKNTGVHVRDSGQFRKIAGHQLVGLDAGRAFQLFPDLDRVEECMASTALTAQATT